MLVASTLPNGSEDECADEEDDSNHCEPEQTLERETDD